MPINKRAKVKREYQCKWKDASNGTLCAKIFNDRVNLTVHHRTHTKSTPFQCKFCPKKFAAFGNRNDHERRHMKFKPYKCPVTGCKKKYYRKY